MKKKRFWKALVLSLVLPEDSVEENSLNLSNENKTHTVKVSLGRQHFYDGAWYPISIDLQKIIQKANENATLIDLETVAHDPTSYINPTDRTSINSVTVAGCEYRLDDIMFTKPGVSNIDNAAPHLFKIGPMYGQMWNVIKTFWVTAEDTDLGMTLFLNDQGEYEFTHIIGQVNGIETKATFDLSCDGGSLKDLDIADADDMENVIIKSIVLYDPDGKIDVDDADLDFQFTIGDALGPCAFSNAKPISCVPEGENDEDPKGTWPFSRSKTNFFPPYLLQENGVIIPNLPDDSKDDQDDEAVYLRSMTKPMYVLAVALYNSGHEIFPNVRALNPAFGTVPEDLLLTCRVTDGRDTDKEIFPVFVVHYPVSNFPLMFDDLEDQVFYINETILFNQSIPDITRFRLPPTTFEAALPQLNFPFMYYLGGPIKERNSSIFLAEFKKRGLC